MPRNRLFLQIAALAIVLSIPTQTFAFIPFICDLCTVGVVAGLWISRYFGIDDTVSGVWIGAILIALISGILTYCDKKKWNFRGRDSIITISTIAFMLVSFYYAGLIGSVANRFTGMTTIFGDKILVSSVVGAIVLITASTAYQAMKRQNGGKPHFPFERVVLPIVSLTLTSFIFYFATLK